MSPNRIRAPSANVTCTGIPLLKGCSNSSRSPCSEMSNALPSARRSEPHAISTQTRSSVWCRMSPRRSCAPVVDRQLVSGPAATFLLYGITYTLLDAFVFLTIFKRIKLPSLEFIYGAPSAASDRPRTCRQGRPHLYSCLCKPQSGGIAVLAFVVAQVRRLGDSQNRRIPRRQNASWFLRRLKRRSG